MLAMIPAAIICLTLPQGQPAPDGNESLSAAIKANDWILVYRLGQHLLRQTENPTSEAEKRTLGAVCFAAYSETQAGRAKEDSLKCLERCTQLLPTEAMPWYYLGAHLNQLEQHEKALVALARYQSIQPKEPHGNYEKGYALNALDRATEAIPPLQEAVQSMPEEAGFRVELAFSLNHLKRPNEALPHLEKAAALKPKLSAYVELSWTYRLLGRWADALTALEKAVAMGMDPKLAAEQRQSIKDRETPTSQTLTEAAVRDKGTP